MLQSMLFSGRWRLSKDSRQLSKLYKLSGSTELWCVVTKMPTSPKLKRGRQPIPVDVYPTTDDPVVAELRRRCQGRNPDDIRRELVQRGLNVGSGTYRSWLMGRRAPRGLNRQLLEAALRGDVLPAATAAATVDEVKGEFGRLLKGGTVKDLHTHLNGAGVAIPFETLRAYAKGHRSPDNIARDKLLTALRQIPTPQASIKTGTSKPPSKSEDDKLFERILAISELAAEVTHGNEEFEAMWRLLWLMDNPESWPFRCPVLVGNEGVLQVSRRISRSINSQVRDSKTLSPEAASRLDWLVKKESAMPETTTPQPSARVLRQP